MKDTVKDRPVRSEETEAVWFLGSEVDREPQKKEHLKCWQLSEMRAEMNTGFSITKMLQVLFS